MTECDWLIVGAGFAGAVLAERLAEGGGQKVLIIDRRDHVAGNAHDTLDDAGVLVHRHGPHIFHTNSAPIFRYLSRFTGWRAYEHRTLALVDGMLVPIPINLDTVNQLYGLSLTAGELERWFADRAEPVAELRTSEDVVVSRIGRELYEKVFRGYTRKQWGLDPSQLDKSVTARAPVRTSRDDRYFTDAFQAMPADGYTRLFERMLDHPNITISLGTQYDEVRHLKPRRGLIFTGAIDAFFHHRLGPLPYRSLRFEHITLDREWFQRTGIVNYPMTEAFTRITEHKHLTGQQHPKTTITREYPCAEGEPYYPVPQPQNAALYRRYRLLAAELPNVRFVGRLATYRYLNMDQVVGQALATYRRIQASELVSPSAPACSPTKGRTGAGRPQ